MLRDMGNIEQLTVGNIWLAINLFDEDRSQNGTPSLARLGTLLIREQTQGAPNSLHVLFAVIAGWRSSRNTSSPEIYICGRDLERQYSAIEGYYGIFAHVLPADYDSE